MAALRPQPWWRYDAGNCRKIGGATFVPWDGSNQTLGVGVLGSVEDVGQPAALDDLPRTGRGKTDKRALMQMAEAHAAAMPTVPTRTKPCEKVRHGAVTVTA